MDPLDLISVASQVAATLRREGRVKEAAALEQAVGAQRYVMQELRKRALFVRDERNQQVTRQMAAMLLARKVVQATELKPSREVVAFHAVRPVGGG